MVDVAADEVRPIVAEILKVAKQSRWTQAHRAGFALALVQSLPYQTDEESLGLLEHFRLPSETLADTDIDCEDTSIFLAGLLDGLTVPYVLLNPPGHIAVGIEGPFRGWYVKAASRQFYYAETTGSGYVIGEPPAGLSKNLNILDVSGHGVVTYSGRLVKNGNPLRPKPTPVQQKRPQSSVVDLSWLMWLVVGGLSLLVLFALSSMRHRAPRASPREEEPEPWQEEDEIFEDDLKRNTHEL